MGNFDVTVICVIKQKQNIMDLDFIFQAFTELNSVFIHFVLKYNDKLAYAVKMQ